jgi:REP element-mobilizing transposase RayT
MSSDRLFSDAGWGGGQGVGAPGGSGAGMYLDDDATLFHPVHMNTENRSEPRAPATGDLSSSERGESGEELRPLTPQQQNVLTVVEDCVRKNGYPPTLREIGQALGLNNVNAVRGHVTALEKKGYITRAPDRARSIQVVRPPSAFSRFKRRLHEVFHTDEGVIHRVVFGLAWTTRRREPFFEGPRAEWVYEVLDREAVEHGWRILERRVGPDHVVVIVEVWPNHSADRSVHRLQSISRVLRRRHPGAFPEGPLWGKGYVATTDLDLLDGLVQELLAMQTGQPLAKVR